MHLNGFPNIEAPCLSKRLMQRGLGLFDVDKTLVASTPSRLTLVLVIL